MSYRFPVRRASLLAAGALAAASLAVSAPSAQAAPVFVDADTALDVSADAYTPTTDDPECLVTATGGTEPNVPVLENGAAAAAATSLSASFSDSGAPADTASGTSQSSGSAKITSVAGSLGTLDFSASTSTQFTNTPGSQCGRSMTSAVTFNFRFIVTTPGFLTLDLDNAGGSRGQFRVYEDLATFDGAFISQEGIGNKFDSTSKVYLPAGYYRGFVSGGSFRSTTGATSGTTSVHAEFSTVGSQTEAVAGKGKTYTTLPGARSCATDSIDAVITKKKAKAAQIKQVSFFVNDKRVKKVKTPDKKDVVKLPVVDGVAADVVAKVELFPAKKGRPAKVVEVSASYEACS